VTEINRVKWTMVFFVMGCLVMAVRMSYIIAKNMQNQRNIDFLVFVCLPFEQLLPLFYVIVLTHYRIYSKSESRQLIQEEVSRESIERMTVGHNVAATMYL